MSLFTPLLVAATSWFGPAHATFDAAITGNPYDFRTNNVHAVFVADDGHREVRLAYFDEGAWNAILTTTHPGHYRATLTRNGAPFASTPVGVDVTTSALPVGGFVRVDGTRFKTDDGHVFFPLGHDLGWQQPDSPTLLDQLSMMGAAGMNWTRVWACAFDGRSPFYSRTGPNPPPGEFLSAPLKRWDKLIATAETSGIHLQFVLFHHGLVSTGVNPNWEENPWSKANGGFLARPQDFFTDATAREYTRRWLRYAVARWGHSPAIMAWELFNEVQWSDTTHQDHDWATVATWHADMAEFIRSIDPYHHLITTSSATDHPSLYDAMDYFQPHVYSVDLTTAIAGPAPLPGKPWFYGEFGGNEYGTAAPDENRIVRDGLWASILAGQAGAAGYWYWDRAWHPTILREFSNTSHMLNATRFTSRNGLHPVAVDVAGTRPATLELVLNRAWMKNKRFTFDLPADAIPAKLCQLSSFIRGPDGREPGKPPPPPVRIRFSTTDATTVRLFLLGAGPHGATLRLILDGRKIDGPTWPATEQSAPPRSTISPPPIDLPVPAGDHELALESAGPDWVQVDRIELPGVGRSPRVMAIGAKDFVLARISASTDTPPLTLDLKFAGLTDGPCSVRTFNLDTGAGTTSDATIVDSTLKGFAFSSHDMSLAIEH